MSELGLRAHAQVHPSCMAVIEPDGHNVTASERGSLVAKERSTAIGSLAEEAKKRGMYARKQRSPKRCHAEELSAVDEVRIGWILSNGEPSRSTQAAAPRHPSALSRNLRARLPCAPSEHFAWFTTTSPSGRVTMATSGAPSVSSAA